MKTSPVFILGTKLDCRGYWCSNCREKDGNPLDNPQMILYLMATKKCNATCHFCDIQRNFLNLPEPEPDLDKFAFVLEDLYSRNIISKISITGGEPLLNPERTNKLLNKIFEINPSAVVDLTTNGSKLWNLDRLENASSLATIHVSRHDILDEANNLVFGLKTIDEKGLRYLIKQYSGKISLNCCLINGHIDDEVMVEKYLDWAATIDGIKSAGFISLMPKNKYCEENMIDEDGILTWIDRDKYNLKHDYLFDIDICECRVWKRVPKSYLPITAFWWKVRRLDLPYCRQLVFTADNKLMINFSEIAEIKV